MNNRNSIRICLLACVVVVLAAIYGAYQATRPQFTVEELHEKWLTYKKDNTKKDLLSDIATMGKSNHRFERNYAIGTLGWIGQTESLPNEYLEIIFGALSHDEITTVCAAAGALAQMRLTKLPPRVRSQLIKIIKNYPGTSQARDAISTFSPLPPSELIDDKELLKVVDDVIAEKYFITESVATKLYEHIHAGTQ